MDKNKRVDRFGHFTVERKNNRIDLTPRGMDLVLRRLRALPDLHSCRPPPSAQRVLQSKRAPAWRPRVRAGYIAGQPELLQLLLAQSCEMDDACELPLRWQLLLRVAAVGAWCGMLISIFSHRRKNPIS